MSHKMQMPSQIIGPLISSSIAGVALLLELIFPGHYLYLLTAGPLGYQTFLLTRFLKSSAMLQRFLERLTANESPEIPSMGPFEELAQAAVSMKDAYNNGLIEARESNNRLDTRIRAGQEAILQLETSFNEQRNKIQTANASIDILLKSLKLITAHLDVLSTSAEESSSSILEMTMTTEEVAENMSVMGASVRDTVSSIDQMAHTIKESADSIDTLSAAAEETSSSMTQIDRSIDQVQSNAKETAKMAAEVSVDAERGAEAIVKTLDTINRIKDSSQEAVTVISSLNDKIGAIGHILNVIDDVSEQTNLLALNAAIIAAQAGEHGKGFAVVADEIKELSERSGVSTKEIADLIKSIQAESRNAIDAVEQGNARVDEGVKVSAEAERALMQILDISKKATEMMNAIARATVEQSYGSKQVTDAISRIAEHVQQIAIATAEQARGSELVISGAETMRSITQHVERSTGEQSKGGKQITEAIEAISKKVRQLGAAHQEQHNQIEELVAISTHISQVSKEQEALLENVKNCFFKSGAANGPFTK